MLPTPRPSAPDGAVHSSRAGLMGQCRGVPMGTHTHSAPHLQSMPLGLGGAQGWLRRQDR